MAAPHVLFDLDGTLTDSSEGIVRSLQHALVTLTGASPPAEQLTWIIGPDIRRSLARLLGTDDRETVEEALGVYRDRYGREGLFENRVYDGVETMLEELASGGATLVVATAKPLVYAEQVVAHFGLDRWFDRVYGPELDGTRSDKAELIAHILEDRVLDSRAAVMVGDRRQDVVGARAVGVRCVGVSYGYGSADELRDADALCERPHDVPGALRRLLTAPA